MIERANRKAIERSLNVEFKQGDAHSLPFADKTFDVVISECTTCILDKERAIQEMVRVAKPGGYVGIHDICWEETTPASLKSKLAQIEGETPETLAGWKDLFERAGMIDVVTVDRSDFIPAWTSDIRKQLGLAGQLKIFIVFRKTPTSGGESGKRFYRIIQSFKIVSSGRWARLRRQTYYGDGF